MSIFSERLKRLTSPRRREVSRTSYERSADAPGFSFAKKESDSELKGVVDELKDNAVKNGEVLKSLSDKVDGLGDFKSIVEDCKKETRDAIHTENVKVYRNVQAVVVDEAGKIKESVEESGRNTEAKVNAAITFSVLAFLIAVLHFAFDILCNLGIF
ncbi:MAG: hypothetical protein IKR39_08460 [Lachnospiraceae bacterium]|nr:hypothetical protein [Lachnospiraceae bacterium]